MSTFLMDWGSSSSCLMHCRPPCLRALPSRKHFGRALVRFKIALSLRASSKNRRFMLIFGQKNDFAFKIVVVEGSVTERFAPLIEQNCASAGHPQIPGFAYSRITQHCAPARDNRVFWRYDDGLYIFKNRAPVQNILEISSIIFIKFDQNDAPVRSIWKIWIIFER